MAETRARRTSNPGTRTPMDGSLIAAAVDYAEQSGARYIHVIIGCGADRLPWMNAFAARRGPEWSSDQRYGDIRRDPRGHVFIELAGQFWKRMKSQKPRVSTEDPAYNTIEGDAPTRPDLLIIASADPRLAELIQPDPEHARRVLVVGVTPRPEWCAEAAIFPSAGGFVGPLTIALGGDMWRPADLARQLRQVADAFQPQ